MGTMYLELQGVFWQSSHYSWYKQYVAESLLYGSSCSPCYTSYLYSLYSYWNLPPSCYYSCSWSYVWILKFWNKRRHNILCCVIFSNMSPSTVTSFFQKQSGVTLLSKKAIIAQLSKWYWSYMYHKTHWNESRAIISLWAIFYFISTHLSLILLK